MAVIDLDPADFRDRLRAAFLPRPFFGFVSTHDECDDGIALRKELPGKCWTDLSSEFLDFNSASLCLLEPAALQSFLPAWLMRSAEMLNDESVLVEYTLYFLCPGDEEDGWQDERIAARVALFDSTQRNLVAEFLNAILKYSELRSWHSYAEFGLKWWPPTPARPAPALPHSATLPA